MTVEAWDPLYAALMRVARRTAESVDAPATTVTIGRSVASTGVEWPQDLTDFYRVHNGQRAGDDSVGEIVPFQRLLSVEAVARRHRDLARSTTPTGGSSASAVTPQHKTESWFPASYLPVAESEDSVTIYDTAAPAGVDRIRRYRFDGSDANSVGWTSIAAMLDGLARCILSLETLTSDLAPYVTQGVLRWGPLDTNYFRSRDDAFQGPFIAPDFAANGTQLIKPVPVEPAADGVDLMAVQHRLLELAAERYGASHITQVGVSKFHLPRIAGAQIGCFVAVDGLLKGYRARALDNAGNFTVEPDS